MRTYLKTNGVARWFPAVRTEALEDELELCSGKSEEQDVADRKPPQ